MRPAGSDWSLPGFARMTVYYASKAFVRSFSEAVSEKTKGTGVTVTAACPGPALTGFEKPRFRSRDRLCSVSCASCESCSRSVSGDDERQAVVLCRRIHEKHELRVKNRSALHFAQICPKNEPPKLSRLRFEHRIANRIKA